MSILWHLLPLFSALPVILTCCFPRQIRFDILVRGQQKYEGEEGTDYSVSHVLFIENISFVSSGLYHYSIKQWKLFIKRFFLFDCKRCSMIFCIWTPICAYKIITIESFKGLVSILLCL